jgi:hypothetical protein
MSQLSALSPKTFDKRTAISGLNSSTLVHQFRQGRTLEAKRVGGGGVGEAQRLDALTQYKTAGMRRVLRGHGFSLLFSGNP